MNKSKTLVSHELNSYLVNQHLPYCLENVLQHDKQVSGETYIKIKFQKRQGPRKTRFSIL
ncbi:hypothetical protein GIB67_007949 [Kingdonia uniflora]|uniref:Uncharacterized protein n=1 Tax=Kingdonia uniflora TaxID=39325 RepID=A0A7J7LTT0_9MAGN|nr:hypothetical protein GIB67_007949 [Kingdonia uniflora]